MNRDEAIIAGKKNAKELDAIYVLFRREGQSEWDVTLYELFNEPLAIFETIRYILPMGEVTKLS